MIDIIPVSSKDGVVLLQGNAEVGAGEWSMNLTIERDRIKHTGKTPSSGLGGLTFSQILTGFASGTGTVRAQFDNTPGQRQPSDRNAWLDQSGTAWLGYTDTVGFIVTYVITDTRPSLNTSNPGATMFDFDFEVADIDFSISGP